MNWLFYTDYDIEGTEIEGTVLKFLKNKGHQYWNLLPQGTGEIQIWQSLGIECEKSRGHSSVTSEGRLKKLFAPVCMSKDIITKHFNWLGMDSWGEM